MGESTGALLGIGGVLATICVLIVGHPPSLELVGALFGGGIFLLDSALWNLTGPLWDDWSPNGVSAGGWAIAGLACGICFGPAVLALRSRRTGLAAVFAVWGLVLAAGVCIAASRGEHQGAVNPWREAFAVEQAARDAARQRTSEERFALQRAASARLERMSSLQEALRDTLATNETRWEAALSPPDEGQAPSEDVAPPAPSKKRTPSARARAKEETASLDSASPPSGKGDATEEDAPDDPESPVVDSNLAGKVLIDAAKRVDLGDELPVRVRFVGVVAAQRECTVLFEYDEGGWKSLARQKPADEPTVTVLLPATAAMRGALSYRVRVDCGRDTWSESGSARIK